LYVYYGMTFVKSRNTIFNDSDIYIKGYTCSLKKYILGTQYGDYK